MDESLSEVDTDSAAGWKNLVREWDGKASFLILMVVVERAGCVVQPRERIVPRHRAARVECGGLNLCMPHELHQRREANACPEHVRGERVPKPVRVCLLHTRGLPVMTEQR